jgi:hypothetical protein
VCVCVEGNPVLEQGYEIRVLRATPPRGWIAALLRLAAQMTLPFV